MDKSSKLENAALRETLLCASICQASWQVIKASNDSRQDSTKFTFMAFNRETVSEPKLGKGLILSNGQNLSYVPLYCDRLIKDVAEVLKNKS